MRMSKPLRLHSGKLPFLSVDKKGAHQVWIYDQRQMEPHLGVTSHTRWDTQLDSKDGITVPLASLGRAFALAPGASEQAA